MSGAKLIHGFHISCISQDIIMARFLQTFHREKFRIHLKKPLIIDILYRPLGKGIVIIVFVLFAITGFFIYFFQIIVGVLYWEVFCLQLRGMLTIVK